MAELDQENNVETDSDQSEVSIDNLKVLENIEVKLNFYSKFYLNIF